MKNKIISLLLSLLLLTALIGCQSDKQLMPPAEDARITINIVFEKSTAKSLVTDLQNQNTLSVIDEVTVAAIDALTGTPVTKALKLEIEGQFAQGELTVPVSGNQPFIIVVFATDVQNLEFFGGLSKQPLFLQAGDVKEDTITVSPIDFRTGPLSIAGLGTPEASSTFPQVGFEPARALDGSFTTSWFSEGENDPNGTFSTFTWTAPEEVLIAAAGIANNSRHSVSIYRIGFGYLGQITFRIFSANEQMVFEETVDYPNTAQAAKMVFPLVRGRKIELLLNQHENPICGGFSELLLLGLR